MAAARAAAPASGRPEADRTSYFYGGGFYPFGGAGAAAVTPPSRNCPLAPPEPTACVPDFFDPLPRRPTAPTGNGEGTAADPGNGNGSRGTHEAEARRRPPATGVDDRRAVAALAPLARADALDQRVRAGLRPHGVAQRARAEAVDDQRPCSRPASDASSR